MKVSDLYLDGIVKDEDIIIIFGKRGPVTRGNWYQDNILKYADRKIAWFCKTPRTKEIVIKLERR